MMMGPSRWGIVCLALSAACSAADNTVDPADLELRDLLGLSPEVASTWNSTQRAAARHVLGAGFREASAASQIAFPPDTGPDVRVASWRAAADARRSADSLDPLGVVRVAVGAHDLALTARMAPMSAIRPGSLWDLAGLANGDILLTVAGEALTSPDDARRGRHAANRAVVHRHAHPQGQAPDARVRRSVNRHLRTGV